MTYLEAVYSTDSSRCTAFTLELAILIANSHLVGEEAYAFGPSGLRAS